MGWFSKVKKYALPTIGAVLGSAILPGVGTSIGASIGAGTGAAIGGGLGGLAAGQSPSQALMTAGGSYLGSGIGSAIFPSSIGSALGSSVSSGLGSTATNAILGSSIGGTLGAAYGSGLGNGGESFLGGGNMPNAPATIQPFKPTQQSQKELPSSLSAFGSLSPDQQSSNIATQGVYGGGNGPQEQEYFLNLVNRRLVDESGNTSEQNTLKPIEQSYLQRLGLGGYGNTNNLLEAITKWKAA